MCRAVSSGEVGWGLTNADAQHRLIRHLEIGDGIQHAFSHPEHALNRPALFGCPLIFVMTCSCTAWHKAWSDSSVYVPAAVRLASTASKAMLAGPAWLHANVHKTTAFYN